jgi:hypothetical protein
LSWRLGNRFRLRSQRSAALEDSEDIKTTLGKTKRTPKPQLKILGLAENYAKN